MIKKPADFGSSGPCEINVNCPSGYSWSDEKRSVALVITSNGTRWCSGSIMNNVRQDLTPYFLTADHCNDGFTAVWVIMFNYESPSCTNLDGPLNYTISGAKLKAGSSATDFCLVELNEAIPDSYYVHYSGWNAVDVRQIMQYVLTIHKVILRKFLFHMRSLSVICSHLLLVHPIHTGKFSGQLTVPEE